MPSRTLTLRAIAAIALLTAAGGARAQKIGYDLERLWLDPSARGALVVGDGRTLHARSLRLAVGAGWERRPLVVSEHGLRGRGLGAPGDRIDDVVTDRWTLHLTGAYALTERLELGLRAPIVVAQQGDVDGLRDGLVGTPSAMVRWGALSQEAGAPFSLAVAGELAWPIHDDDDLDGDPEPYLTPRVEIGRTFGKVLVAANLGANVRFAPVELGDERLHSELTAGAVVATTGAPLRWELSARGAANVDGLGPHGELLGGVRWDLGPAELFALAGPGFASAPGTPTFRGLVGLAIAPGQPAPAAPPAAQADPCAPGEAHEPAQCPALDDDQDGVVNGKDRCPTVKGVPEAEGCPATDGDGDGIADPQDKCPKVKGSADHQGCPAPDRDADGVLDATDRCPDQAGTAEYQGCPAPTRAEIKGGKIDIREKVFFETGKNAIQARSHALLDDVAKLIVANPAAGRVRIEGHTDDRGPAALNRKLSQARAEAVRDYLVARGVDAARLEAVGYGPDRPTATNATAAGREANRRVEFSVLGVDAK